MKKFFTSRNASIITFLVMILILLGVVIYSNVSHSSGKPKKSDIKLNFEPVTEAPAVTEEQLTDIANTESTTQKSETETESVINTEINTEAGTDSGKTADSSVKAGSIDFWTNWESSNFEDMYVYKPDADDRFADMLGNLISGYIIGCPATTREFEDTYAKGFLPNVKSVSVSNIDSLYNNADALVTFNDDTTKTYTVSWTIDSYKLIDTLSLTEKQ